MNELLLTIVIPTYNMEDLLPRCLDSFCTPLLEGKVEVLIINDGSKDQSLNIANAYADKNPNIFRVIDKANGNYGSCVNRGLKDAKGTFFRLLDADDWFIQESIITFTNKLSEIENDIDVILSNFSLKYVDESRDKTINPSNIEYLQKYSFDQIDFDNLGMEKMLCMHAITYRLSLLKDINLIHQEGISYTDIEYCYFPLIKAKNLVFLDINLYQYFLGREGQTMTPESMVKNKLHTFKVVSRVVNDYLTTKQLSEIRAKNLCQVIKNILHSYYATILILDKKDVFEMNALKELDKRLKDNIYLYNIISDFTYKKIPFVKLWHSIGVRSSMLK